jgi:hypothetical protein
MRERRLWHDGPDNAADVGVIPPIQFGELLLYVLVGPLFLGNLDNELLIR